jgi:hypothetical protein
MIGIHLRREYPTPEPLGNVLRRFARLTVHDPSHGVDPLLAARQRPHAGQLNPVSPIASADGLLPYGKVRVDPRRRVWRYRALDAATYRPVFERYIESETAEGAAHEGMRMLQRDWRKVGLSGTETILGTVLAV